MRKSRLSFKIVSLLLFSLSSFTKSVAMNGRNYNQVDDNLNEVYRSVQEYEKEIRNDDPLSVEFPSYFGFKLENTDEKTNEEPHDTILNTNRDNLGAIDNGCYDSNAKYNE